MQVDLQHLPCLPCWFICSQHEIDASCHWSRRPPQLGCWCRRPRGIVYICRYRHWGWLSTGGRSQIQLRSASANDVHRPWTRMQEQRTVLFRPMSRWRKHIYLAWCNWDMWLTDIGIQVLFALALCLLYWWVSTRWSMLLWYLYKLCECQHLKLMVPVFHFEFSNARAPGLPVSVKEQTVPKVPNAAVEFVTVNTWV
jgi:hypothetical protein